MVFLSTPSFASGYIVNGPAGLSRGAAPGSSGVQRVRVGGQRVWASAERAPFTPLPATESSRKTCYYALDVLLCD